MPTEPSAESLKRAKDIFKDCGCGRGDDGLCQYHQYYPDLEFAIIRAIDEAATPHVEALHSIRDDLEAAMNSNRSPEIRLFATQMLKGWRTQLDAIGEARQ